jgi:anti-sigma regulatory factor (Ser/Thr protein kinase)
MTTDDGTETSNVRLTGGPAQPPDEVALDQSFDRERLYSLRAAVAAHATELGLPEHRLSGLLVVATELVTNAIRHGGGVGRLRLWRTAATLYLQVRDEGLGIADPQTAGTVPVPLTAVSGRGLWIVRKLCDGVDIANTDGTTVTVMLDDHADRQ